MTDSNIIEIAGDVYRMTVNSSRDMWCSEKTGEFGEGVGNTDKDPKWVERMGRLCEMGFSIWSGLPANLEYIKGGDKYDFIVHGKTIDVKKSYRNILQVMCRHKSDGKYILDNPKKQPDLYVPVRLIYEDVKEDYAKVKIMGYFFGEEVRDHSNEKRCQVPGKVFINHVVYLRDAHPPENLKNFINSPVTIL